MQDDARSNDVPDIRADLRKLRKCVTAINVHFDGDSISLKRCINETWFSDILGWLLNPRAKHGFRSRFLKALLDRIAANRVKNPWSDQRSNIVRTREQKRGVLITSKAVANATAVREFYLSPATKRRGRKGRYADIVVMDLDCRDRIFIVLELKLFTANHLGQLRDLYKATSSKFDQDPRLNVREHVNVVARRF